MPNATIQEYKQNPSSGRWKVKLMGQFYNVSNDCDLSPQIAPVGTTIGFDSNEGKPYNGKPVWWLNTYNIIGTAAAPLPPTGAPQQGGNVPSYQQATVQPPKVYLQGGGRRAAPADGDNKRLLSNVLSALVGAQLITTQKQFEDWWDITCACIDGQQSFEKDIP